MNSVTLLQSLLVAATCILKHVLEDRNGLGEYQYEGRVPTRLLKR